MKEILFRGKRVDNGKFIISDSLMQIKGENSCLWVELEGWVKVVPETVGQYTGFRDDQGVRIFEGDIVDVSYDDGTAYLTEVRAYGNTLCVDVEGEDYDFTAVDFAVEQWRVDGCELKVISNIYDKDKDADATIEFLNAQNIFI